ncbi:MAG: hypothetical protein HYS09_08545 [Chloroflexi bacterium]|nr:hypothetical protein [Chloroflexota bacterium]
MASRLEQAVTRFRRRAEAEEEALPQRAAAFRAAVQERLRGLEREVADLKGRINGLLFLAAGAVLAQVVLKLLE